MGEGLLALCAIIAVSAGFATRGEWEAAFSGFGMTGIDTFVAGGSTIVTAGTGLPIGFTSTLLAVMAVLFAGTTMDTGVRLQRYIVQEWGTIYDLPVLQNGYIATFIAVGSCLALAFGAGGADGQGGMLIWPLFGTTNQLLAGLTLLVISVMLVKRRRPYGFTLAPMIFVTIMAFLAALYQLWNLYTTGQYFLAGLDILIVVAAVLVALEATSAFIRERKKAGEGPTD